MNYELVHKPFVKWVPGQSPTLHILVAGTVLKVRSRLARMPGGGSNTNTRPARNRFTGSWSKNIKHYLNYLIFPGTLSHWKQSAMPKVGKMKSLVAISQFMRLKKQFVMSNAHITVNPATVGLHYNIVHYEVILYTAWHWQNQKMYPTLNS